MRIGSTHRIGMPALRAARVKEDIVKVPENEVVVALRRPQATVAGGIDLEEDLAIHQQREKLGPRETFPAIEPFDLLGRGQYRDGGSQACYVQRTDNIHMPCIDLFRDADGYTSTKLHELTHWTGPKDRCDRDLQGRFGDKHYAAEELVAELGSAFQCAELAFDNDVRNAGYIAHWIRLLKDDKKAFFTASSAAQKAVDFLRDKVMGEEEPMVEAA